jgi:acylphosphatase
MAKKLILRGIVQGVFCRAYCSQYARKLKIRGGASNLPDGTVRVILNTDDAVLINRYISELQGNPSGFTFYGSIDSVEVHDHKGPVTGDYQF